MVCPKIGIKLLQKKMHKAKIGYYVMLDCMDNFVGNWFTTESLYYENGNCT